MIMRGLYTLIVAATVGLALQATAEERITLSRQQIANLGITLITPKTTREIPVLQAPARITIPPDQEYLVSTPYPGLVGAVKAALGEQVSKNQLLAQINSPEVLVLQRDLLNDSSELQLARAKKRRDEILLKEGVISQRRWQETKTLYSKYATAVNEAKQQLKIASLSESDIQRLMRDRRLSSVLNIRAPTSGVILEKNIVAGQRVDALAPLFRLADLKTLWLDIDIPQERIGDIGLDDAVTIDGSERQARVILIGQSVNPDNQSVLVRAVFDHPNRAVRPGQKVSVRLLKPAGHSMLSVPVSAVLRKDQQSYVFVPVTGGFEARPVAIAGRAGQSVAIREGLKAGEPVVVKGVAALKASWMGLGGGD